MPPSPTPVRSSPATTAEPVAPMCAGPPFRVSIVVEWDNAGRAGNARADEMLRALHAQIDAADPAWLAWAEVIFVYPDEADRRWIEAAVAEANSSVPGIAIRYELAPSQGYYNLKNRGAELARGDIIILIDSDVIPQPHWLARLVATFEDPGVDIASGATWVDHDGFYSKAMALGWTFPLRPERPQIAVRDGFHANNVAFRAGHRRHMSFPDNEQYRGQGVDLMERLRKSDQIIFFNFGAQVAHPPPAGVRGFTTRALWSGYDLSVRQRRKGFAGLWPGMRNVIADAAKAVGRVAKHFRKVGLGVPGAAGAAFVVAGYQAFRAAGYLIGYMAPERLNKLLTRIAP